MGELTVRTYNVGFGDAILVTFPDKNQDTGIETNRSILIDVGNLAVGKGSGRSVFDEVVGDIEEVMNGRNIDLYVMTHEHYDHVTGLFDAFYNYQKELDFDYGWLTASCAPGYYGTHREAARRRDLIQAHYRGIALRLSAAPGPEQEALRGLLANNDPVTTQARVKYLQGKAKIKTHYVHADLEIERGIHHPFDETELSVLAPEEDTAVYPVGLQPLPLLMGPQGEAEGEGPGEGADEPRPPPGVDHDAFSRLVQRRSMGMATDLLAIDRAANNTSVVFKLKWRGWVLLFTGDAEVESWETMVKKERSLEPVHFLKVGHHGSRNGTPDDDILERVLPGVPPDAKERIAVVSTCHGTTFGNVPDQDTLDRLEDRCTKLESTESLERGKAVVVRFEG